MFELVLNLLQFFVVVINGLEDVRLQLVDGLFEIGIDCGREEALIGRRSEAQRGGLDGRVEESVAISCGRMFVTRFMYGGLELGIYRDDMGKPREM